MYLALTPRGINIKRQALRRKNQIGRRHIFYKVVIVSNPVTYSVQDRGQFVNQLPAERIVGIDYRVLQAGGVKQQFFSSAVAIHITVVIQMIATQIGKHRHFKINSADPATVR